MGSPLDLGTNERIKQFDELREIVVSRKQHCSPFEQALMVDHFKVHGFVRMKQAITQCMANDWLKPILWLKAAQLIQAHGSDNFDWAVERSASLGHHSMESVERILTKQMPAYRKVAVETTHPQPAGIKKRPKYPTPEQVHTEATAREWLLRKGFAVEEATTYFELAGRDNELNCPLLKLKSEYR